jgi:hypothetical protein
MIGWKIAFVLAFALGLSSAGAEAPGPLTVVGVVVDSAGAPVVGETVFFARSSNRRVTVEFNIKDGTTSGLWNPSASTDAKGRFKIQVGPEHLAGSEFTIGILDCPRCFTNPSRQLMRDGKALVFTLPAESTKVAPQFDVGTLTRK